MERCELKTSVVGEVAAKENSVDDLVKQRSNEGCCTKSSDQLVSILVQNNFVEGTNRKPICLEPKAPRRRESTVSNILQANNHQRVGICGNPSATVGAKYAGGNSVGKQKIPRPANAFMLFANEWRKKLAVENPRESNKDISVRLGILWKNMEKDLKEKYFTLSREVDAEHKRKYPDYVYNPKEARLRKAMREQSRELSRQSILQTAIASAATSTGNGSGSIVPSSAGFPTHHLACSSSAASDSPMSNSPLLNSGRIVNPWFAVGPTSSSTHLKPIISPRIMAAHQRSIERTKEAMRKQVECAAAGVFSAGPNNSGVSYPGDAFGNHNSLGGANDYCIIAEFGDGQKWHPYQNGGNPYHGRGAGMSKMGIYPNSGVHGPWAQFCGLPLPTSVAQNPVIRPPRQMVFLQEQQSQHCAFPDEMQLSYVHNKLEVNPRSHSSYQNPSDSQGKSSVSPPQMQQLQDEDKCGSVATSSWESGTPTSGVSSLLHESGQEPEDDVHGETQEHEESRQKPSSKQPLPGFHQAFGSTEIGRFSRSEFFANMVGENSSTISDVYLPAPVFPFSPTTQSILGPSSMPSSIGDEDLLQMMPDECYWLSTPSQYNHSQGMENATVFHDLLDHLTRKDVSIRNYAAFMDYSHRLSQDWLHPVATPQELQAAFIDQPGLFHETNALLGHEHPNYGNYSCQTFEQPRQPPSTSLLSEKSLNQMIAANEQLANEQPVVIKQNDRICVMLESNKIQLENDTM